mgnify:CR=1 FL=1|jgi:alpha/beta superfamily hydrolase
MYPVQQQHTHDLEGGGNSDSEFLPSRPIQTRVDGRLCAYIHQPERDTQPGIACIVVHQCTALGGSAHTAEDIARAVCAQGLVTISFDLRGAGDSDGCCCMWPVPIISGCPEVSDVVAMAEWVKETMQRDTWIVAVSAGGAVGAGAIDALPCIRGYCSVAYTFGVVTTLLWAPQTLRLLFTKKPKLLIQGDFDVFSSVLAFRCWTALMCRPRTAVLVPGAGHFDLEFSPLAQLDGRLIGAFIRNGGASLPARLEDGRAIHLSAARCRPYVTSLCACGPLIFFLLLGVMVWIGVVLLPAPRTG